MSGDRLAQIERQVRFVYGRNPDGNGLVLPNRDVLALVEIAKAARVFLEEHQKQKGAVLGEFDFLVYDEMETRLREALARLDSGADEEDA